MEAKTTIVKSNLEDGTTIYIQATALGGEEYISSKLLPFNEVTTTIKGIAKSVVETLKEVRPRSASVEFGLEIGVESGALTTLLVKGSGTANLKITLEWGEVENNVTSLGRDMRWKTPFMSFLNVALHVYRIQQQVNMEQVFLSHLNSFLLVLM